MKFTNSPFTILDKNMNALDYQKRNLINEDYWGRENDNQTKEDFKYSTFCLLQIDNTLFILFYKEYKASQRK